MVSPLRIKWKNNPGKVTGQFIIRMSIMVVSILVLLIIELLFNSMNIRNYFSRQLLQESGKNTLRVVDDLYQPLLNTLSFSSFWVEVAGIESLESMETASPNLERMIRSQDVFKSLTLLDNQGNTIDVMVDDQGDVSINKNNIDDPLNLINQRISLGMNPIELGGSLSKGGSGSWGAQPSNSYKLPDSQLEGMTIYYRLYSDGENYIEMWLDLTLISLAERFTQFALNQESVIFFLLGTDDHVLFPIKDITSFQKNRNYELLPDFKGHKEGKSVLDQIRKYRTESGDEKISDLSIEQGGEKYWTQYNTIMLMNHPLVIGSYTPEKTLSIFRYQIPFQIIGIVLILLLLSYLYIVLNDFKKIRSGEREFIRSRKMINKGETIHCEFKSSLRWDYREEKANKALEDVIMKSVAAFNNSDGGTLFIGVADDGTILGLENDYTSLKEVGKDYFELHLRNLVSKKYGVAYGVEHLAVYFFKVDGKEFCRIDISKGKKPLYTVAQEKGRGTVEKFYVRSGNSSRQMTSIKEISEYVMKHFYKGRFIN